MMLPGYLAMVGLLWGMDPSTTKVDEFFVMIESVENVTGLQRAVVAGTINGACTQAPGGQPGDYCTQLACPGPGTFRITVEARPYGTRSNTVTLRVKDSACAQVEGVVLGTPPTSVPTATHCQPSTPVRAPAPVPVQVPRQQTVTAPVPVPQETAPVIPANPRVVPKVPLEPGTTSAPALARTPKIPTDGVPPPPTAQVPAGPPETLMVAQPAPTPPGRPCP